MPELAEVRLTADYINGNTWGKTFNQILKNPKHKGNSVTLFSDFTISAESRGKELRLKLTHNDEVKYLNMTMGMSGFFKMTKTGEELKHSHLMFKTNNGLTLSFVDVRRFGKWWLADDWSTSRGPDPCNEFELFKNNIYNNLDKSAFDKGIHIALMNQRYFNGIGNYLRSEILYRIPDLNPFTPARKAIQEFPQILDLCKQIPLTSYVLGGGQLKDWVSPFETNPQDMHIFIKCYGNPNMAKMKDEIGRTFWFDSKWITD